MDTVSSGGSAINALKKIVDADNPKINKANSNLKKAEQKEYSTRKTRTTSARQYKASKLENDESGNVLTQAVNKKTNSAANMLKKATKYSTTNETYRIVSRAIKDNKPVELKGLKGDELKAAKKYNASLKQKQYVDSRVQAGRGVSTSKVDKDLKALAREYNNDTKATKSAQEQYEKAVDAHNKAKENLTNAQFAKDSMERSTTAEQRALANLDTSKQSYLLQNDWLDEEIKILEDENKQYLDAVKKTTKTADRELKNRDKKQKSLLKNKSFIKSLTDEQLEGIKNNEQIDLDGLVGNNLKLGEQWNKTVQKTTVALDAQTTAVGNLTESEANLAQKLVDNEKQKLENISNFYDAFIAQFENKNSIIESSMNELEAKGYSMSRSFYEAQIQATQATVKSLEEQRKAMMESFQNAVNEGTIVEGTTEYYEMQAAIDKVTLSLQQAKTNIAQLEKSIRDLEWKQFDRLQESIKRIASESDFLIDLMSHKELYNKETGLLTDEGMATMGLHGLNYNTYMSQADKYKEEMLKISAELANDPYNQELIDRKNELVDSQQQAILAAENEKKAIRDLVEDGIEFELDAIDDLIDKYLKALEAKKALYEFEKRVQKQAEEIASLQKQLAVYENDKSEEARAKVQEIRVNLKEAQENLKEAEYDKFIDDQKELLENLRNEYEEVLNKRLDNVDVLIETSIEQINANASDIQKTLTEQADKVGYTLSPEMEKIWDSTNEAKDVLSVYSDKFSSDMTTLQGTISGITQKQQDMINALEAQAKNIISAINESMKAPVYTPKEDNSNKVDNTTDKTDKKDDNPPKTNNTPKKEDPPKKNTSGGDGVAKVGDVVTYVSGRYYEASDGSGKSGNLYLGKKVKITGINKASWAKYPYCIDSSDGKTGLGWVKLDQLKGYASGGRVDKDQWAFMNERGQELIEYKGATLLPLPKDADIWNAPKTQALIRDISNPPSSFTDYTDKLLKSLQSVGAGNGATEQTHIDTLNISLPNVKEPEEFIDYLIKSKRFEKAITTMTIDRAVGRATSLSKNMYIRH